MKILCAVEQNPLYFTVALAELVFDWFKCDFESPKLEVHICMMVRY